MEGTTLCSSSSMEVPTVPRLANRWMVLFLLLLTASMCARAVEASLDGYVIGVYVDEGARASCVSHAIEMFEWMGLTIREITAARVNAGGLSDLDAIYFPGGDSPPYIGRITRTGKQKLVDAVTGGLVYIGTCAGSMFAAEVQDSDGVRYREGQLGVFRGDAIGPAAGICEDEWCHTMLVANSEHPTSAGLPPEFPALWYNSPYFVSDPDAETCVLARYVATGEAAIVVQHRGDGWVLLTGPHPEYEGEETWGFMKRYLLWSLGLLNEEDDTET